MSDQRSPMLPNQTAILHGGDWNPDQWLATPAVIDEDFRLFQRAGVNSVTLGIFAWSALEPWPGDYRFDWLARILDRCHEAAVGVVLATPSGAKPAWLSQAHPEVERMQRFGGPREPWRGRHNHCPTSPVYREYVARIDGELARRFGRHPAVRLWHLSNEYGGECRCEACVAAFRVWLEDRYGSLEAVNQAWWNAFWGHSLNDWRQIHPEDTVHDGKTLDWKRFVTHQTVDFMRVEIEAVRAHSAVPLTTNFMGRYPGLDYWRLAEHLDVIANDCYPRYSGRGDESAKADDVAMVGDLMRTLAGGSPWLLMESTPSQLNWDDNYMLKRPGAHAREMRRQLGLGADGTCYFQWRKGRGAAEKFHGAVVDHEGSERPRVFREVAEHGADLNRFAPILGSRVESPVAVVYDWETRWALATSHGPHRIDPEKGYEQAVIEHHAAFRSRGIDVDVPERRCELSAYRLVVLPMGYLVDQVFAKKLRAFVAGGGVLLATYLTGWVDETNRCHLGGFPGGGLREVFGVWSEELDGLADGEAVAIADCGILPGLPATATAGTFCEVIHAEDAEVVATYASEFYAGSPALTRHRFGSGTAYYLAARCQRSYLDALADALVSVHAIPALCPTRPPQGVRVTSRRSADGEFRFVHHFGVGPCRFQLAGGPWTDLASGQDVGPILDLEPLASRVLQPRG